MKKHTKQRFKYEVINGGGGGGGVRFSAGKFKIFNKKLAGLKFKTKSENVRNTLKVTQHTCMFSKCD